ncbi:MAG TPA: N-methyl-L-tryptophan oxidase [Planctomycetaceae bacterium]|nr:N-methyl-L-tryptophan oxidase [Planctomycetaceae bacterium]
MTNQSYDAIVIGTGGFGSSALYQLAHRGLRVLGLDRFPPAHDRGSSHGQTRIIRQAYFEHVDYVPLLKRAYALWRDLEAESGRDLMTLCGLLVAGPRDGIAVPGARFASQKHDLELQNVSRAERETRFPGFRIPENFDAVFEAAGGYLLVEECVRTYLELAQSNGAELLTGVTVTGWEAKHSTVVVETDRGTFEAAKLILTPGAWASQLLNAIPEMPPFQVVRKVLQWHPVRSPVYDLSAGGCGYFFEMPYGEFYGFPSLDGNKLKVGEHTGGEIVADPLLVDRNLHESDRVPVRKFLEQVMPDIDPDPMDHAVCLYTKSPDCHFVIDQHPEHENVLFAAGFSGHGFKFTSVIGAALTDLAIDGTTELPIGFLSLARFSL